MQGPAVSQGHQIRICQRTRSSGACNFWRHQIRICRIGGLQYGGLQWGPTMWGPTISRATRFGFVSALNHRETTIWGPTVWGLQLPDHQIRICQSTHLSLEKIYRTLQTSCLGKFKCVANRRKVPPNQNFGFCPKSCSSDPAWIAFPIPRISIRAFGGGQNHRIQNQI